MVNKLSGKLNSLMVLFMKASAPMACNLLGNSICSIMVLSNALSPMLSSPLDKVMLWSIELWKAPLPIVVTASGRAISRIAE